MKLPSGAMFCVSLLALTSTALTQEEPEADLLVIDGLGAHDPGANIQQSLMFNCVVEGSVEGCRAVSAELQISEPAERPQLEVRVIGLDNNGKVTTDQSKIDTAGADRSAIAIDVAIEFDFDSAIIRSSEERKLKMLTQALLDPRAGDIKFLLVGHTDALGSDTYNCHLSNSRASAVRGKLISHGVTDHRLASIGVGESMLKTGIDPLDPQNRRVGFIKLSVDSDTVISRLHEICR